MYHQCNISVFFIDFIAFFYIERNLKPSETIFKVYLIYNV